MTEQEQEEEKKMKIITETKDEALNLRWLQLPVTNRYEGILVDAIEAFSTDGYRIHRAPVPAPLGGVEPESVLRIRDGKKLHKTGGRAYDAEVVDVNYPPEIATFGPKGPPLVTVAVNRDFLTEALEVPTNDAGVVHISVWGWMEPVRVENADESAEALVMPMNIKKEHPEGTRLEALVAACIAAKDAIDHGPDELLSPEEENALELIEEALS